MAEKMSALCVLMNMKIGAKTNIADDVQTVIKVNFRNAMSLNKITKRRTL